MYDTKVATIAELTDAELDVVAAGALVDINLPIALNVDVGLATQVNTVLFSKAVAAGGGQWVSLTSIAIAKAG